MRSPLETTGNSKIPFNLKEKNCTTSWLTSRDSRDSRVIQGLIIQGFAKHITLCSRRCIMYRIWSPSARNEWHPGSNQHRKCWIIWMQKGSSRRPNQQSAATRAQSIPFHSYSSDIHQVFIRYSSGIHQTNQVLRISALENNGNNGSHCNRNRVTSCHIRAADPQADFPIVSGNARLRAVAATTWRRISRISRIRLEVEWDQHGANMEQLFSNMLSIWSTWSKIFHRSHEKSGEYQHSWYQLIYTSSMKKSPIMIWSNGPRG